MTSTKGLPDEKLTVEEEAAVSLAQLALLDRDDREPAVSVAADVGSDAGVDSLERLQDEPLETEA